MMKANGSSGLRRGRLVIAATAAVLLAGCETLFDSPSTPEAVRQEAMARKMNDLVSSGEKQAMDAAPVGLKEVGIEPQDILNSSSGVMMDVAGKAAGAAREGVVSLAASANAAAAQPKTPDGREMPILSFERAEADMPYLAVQGMDGAVFRIDNRRIELGGVTRAGRIGLVAPGRHVLRIECPNAPPFSADFRLKKNERIVVRGNCSPPPALNSRR
ncbi:MAG: hypothetical protein LBR95_07580 [Azoarcus sp.]|jgi:hypothetical protein|nr:hypothetical protein [Azoarcus sp.]